MASRQKPRYAQSDADFEHLTMDCLNDSDDEQDEEESLMPQTQDYIDTVRLRDSQMVHQRGHIVNRKLNFDN